MCISPPGLCYRNTLAQPFLPIQPPDRTLRIFTLPTREARREIPKYRDHIEATRRRRRRSRRGWAITNHETSSPTTSPSLIGVKQLPYPLCRALDPDVLLRHATRTCSVSRLPSIVAQSRPFHVHSTSVSSADVGSSFTALPHGSCCIRN